MRPLPEASWEWILPQHTAKEGQLAGPLRCAGVPTAGATFAGVPRGRGWSSARVAKDSKGPKLPSNGPCSGQEHDSHKTVCFPGSHFRGFSITGRVENRFGFPVPFKRRVPVRPQGQGWEKLSSQAFLEPSTHTVPCQGMGGAGPANQPAGGIAGSRSPSLGNACPSWPPDSFAGARVYPDPASAALPCPPWFQCFGVLAPCPAAPGSAASCCRVSLCRLVAGAGLGTGVPWAAFVLGLGALMLPTKGLAVAGGRAGLVWWPSLRVFQAMISAWWHPSAPAIPSALAAGRIWFPMGTAAASHVLCPALLRLSGTRERHPPADIPQGRHLSGEQILRHGAGRAPAGAVKDGDSPRMGMCVPMPWPSGRQRLPGPCWGLVPLASPGSPGPVSAW